MKIFVTGGSGYIGSITVTELLRAGHTVTVFDHSENPRFSTSPGLDFVKGDLLDPASIKAVLSKVKPDAVLHFAAYIEMGESVREPRKYYENNVLGSYNLANAMVDSGVDKIVFSSSAGVYGNPASVPIPEDACCRPENPYGETKLTVERLLRWYEKPYGLRSICTRYFNAAGATLDGKAGENHDPESHLIPTIIKAQLANKEFTLFGDDYHTKDGTCVRDYIHVLDLASAHLKALTALESGATSNFYNVGTGVGYSNREIIKMVEKISGKPVQMKVVPRRPGDADELVADVSKIKRELKFTPQYSDLETIIKTAYAFHVSH